MGAVPGVKANAPPVQLDDGQLSAMRVLVVDDSKAQRTLLSASLAREGHDVMQAADGAAALALCKSRPFDLILSDWMMPGMNGPEFCQAFRALETDNYTYFILLTSKNERAEISHGLELGADDFVTKPVNAIELRARMQAGARLVRMQRELSEKNALLGDTLAELQSLYDMVESDLKEARKLQQSLLRDRYLDFGAGQVSLLLRSSGHVGGDLVGVFQATSTQIALYSIDVSGHGISSALMTARLAGHLSTRAPEHNIALTHTAGSYYRVLPTNDVVSRFNDLMSTVIDTDHYFTIVIAVVDLDTGQVRLAQAGHPYPIVQRADGSVELVGNGGLPVGLLEAAQWDEVVFKLEKGDRLLLYSDGLSECTDPGGTMLEEEGLEHLLVKNHAIKGPALLEALLWDLVAFRGSDDMDDDVSAALFEFTGPADKASKPSG